MEKVLFSHNIMYCTKKDLLEALANVKDTDMILISDSQDFYTIKQIVYDDEGDVVIRMSDKMY